MNFWNYCLNDSTKEFQKTVQVFKILGKITMATRMGWWQVVSIPLKIVFFKFVLFPKYICLQGQAKPFSLYIRIPVLSLSLLSKLGILLNVFRAAQMFFTFIASNKTQVGYRRPTFAPKNLFGRSVRRTILIFCRLSSPVSNQCFSSRVRRMAISGEELY